MSTPALSVLIPATPRRYHSHLWPLWQKLEAQAAALPDPAAVELLVFLDNRQRTIGEKRDALVQISRGAFVAFCDDDDDVAPDYLAQLTTAIGANPDASVITFTQRAIIDGVEGLCRFGLLHPNEPFNPAGFRRAPWHVCAWRGDLARRTRFPASNYGEDWAWARHLVIEATDRLRHFAPEHVAPHIPAVLHTYRYDTAVSEAPPPPKTHSSGRSLGEDR